MAHTTRLHLLYLYTALSALLCQPLPLTAGRRICVCKHTHFFLFSPSSVIHSPHSLRTASQWMGCFGSRIMQYIYHFWVLWAFTKPGVVWPYLFGFLPTILIAVPFFSLGFDTFVLKILSVCYPLLEFVVKEFDKELVVISAFPVQFVIQLLLFFMTSPKFMGR